jgi:hypothetical protein
MRRVLGILLQRRQISMQLLSEGIKRQMEYNGTRKGLASQTQTYVRNLLYDMIGF